MARPSRAELREGFELTGQRVANDEGFLGVMARGISGILIRSPEVEKAVGGGDGVEGGEGEEREGESEPLI